METIENMVRGIEKKALDSITREQLAEEAAEDCYELIRSLNITDPERIARIAFQFGRAHGLNEAANMITESHGLKPTI